MEAGRTNFSKRSNNALNGKIDHIFSMTHFFSLSLSLPK